VETDRNAPITGKALLMKKKTTEIQALAQRSGGGVRPWQLIEEALPAPLRPALPLSPDDGQGASEPPLPPTGQRFQQHSNRMAQPYARRQAESRSSVTVSSVESPAAAEAVTAERLAIARSFQPISPAKQAPLLSPASRPFIHGLPRGVSSCPRCSHRLRDLTDRPTGRFGMRHQPLEQHSACTEQSAFDHQHPKRP